MYHRWYERMGAGGRQLRRALLVIDVQKVYTCRESELFCPDSAATVGRINRLISSFQTSGEPIVLIRHVHRADGSDLGRMFDFLGAWNGSFNFKEGTEEVEYDDNLLRPGGAIEMAKNRYSTFANTDLQRQLQAAGVEALVICGFMTNFCCDTSARDAHDLDYYVDFVLDATGTPGTPNMDEEAVRKAEADFMQAGFARVLSTEEFLDSRLPSL
jgi:nicotinamidase-related amidase